MDLTDRDRSLLFRVLEDCSNARYSLGETLLESWERNFGLSHSVIFTGSNPSTALASAPVAMRGRATVMVEPYSERYYKDDVFRTAAGMQQLSHNGIVSLHDIEPVLRDQHPAYVRDFHGGFGTRSVVAVNIQLMSDACAVAIVLDFDGNVPTTTMRRLTALRPLLASQFRGFHSPPASENPHLTRREQQIVSLIMQGYGNREIARECGVKPDSIKRYLTAIYSEFGVQNRTQLALTVAKRSAAINPGTV